MITAIELARIIADSIIFDCKEDGFESFKEMCKCNWWDSNDIREYISEIMDSKPLDSGTYIDEIEGDVLIGGAELLPFRNFMVLIRRCLKEKGF